MCAPGCLRRMVPSAAFMLSGMAAPARFLVDERAKIGDNRKNTPAARNTSAAGGKPDRNSPGRLFCRSNTVRSAGRMRRCPFQEACLRKAACRGRR